MRGPGWNWRMDKRMDRRTNKSPPVFYRTSSPSRPLPCFLLLQFKIMESRATGIADHILPLGNLLFFQISYIFRFFSNENYIRCLYIPPSFTSSMTSFSNVTSSEWSLIILRVQLGAQICFEMFPLKLVTRAMQVVYQQIDTRMRRL